MAHSRTDVMPNALLVDLIEGMPLAMGLSAHGAVVHTNVTMRTLLGLADDDDGCSSVQHLLDALPLPVSAEVERAETSFETADGEVRWARLTRIPVSDHVDPVVSHVLAVEDVTARHQVEVEVQTSQRLEAMGRLASGVAHEINTPIQFVGDNVTFLADAIDSLIGIIDVLVADLRDVQLNIPRPERVERVEALLETHELDYYREESPLAASQAQDGVERIATIVRAMKALGHPDQGQMTYADLDQCLRDTVTVTRGSVKQIATIDLSLGDLPPVMCLPGSISQVVMNLVVNAADAIRTDRAESAPGRIGISSVVDGDHVLITVSDDGGGIPPAVQDRIFEPFFTTKDVGQGTGQGLALARTIVCDLHQGSLTFDTTPGEGTTFAVRLPLDGPLHARDPQGA